MSWKWGRTLPETTHITPLPALIIALPSRLVNGKLILLGNLQGNHFPSLFSCHLPSKGARRGLVSRKKVLGCLDFQALLCCTRRRLGYMGRKGYLKRRNLCFSLRNRCFSLQVGAEPLPGLHSSALGNSISQHVCHRANRIYGSFMRVND